jgi:hypothetical protein
LSDGYGSMLAAAAKPRCRAAVVDGEVGALDENGRSNFQ